MKVLFRIGARRPRMPGERLASDPPPDGVMMLLYCLWTGDTLDTEGKLNEKLVLVRATPDPGEPDVYDVEADELTELESRGWVHPPDGTGKPVYLTNAGKAVLAVWLSAEFTRLGRLRPGEVQRRANRFGDIITIREGVTWGR